MNLALFYNGKGGDSDSDMLFRDVCNLPGCCSGIHIWEDGILYQLSQMMVDPRKSYGVSRYSEWFVKPS